MLIYVPKVTPRVSYIFSLVMNDLIGADIELTCDLEQFLGHDGPKLAYAAEPPGDTLFVESSGFLSHDRVEPTEISMINYGGYPAFFGVKSERSIIPFDLFAASFFLVSRYEEYLPFRADRHGRFPVELSLAYREDFLHLPLVNIWAEMLKDILKKFYPLSSFREKQFRVTPTVDIDHAFAYLSRSVHRVLGGYARSLQKLNFLEIIDRTAVLLCLKRDPYDSYSMIDRIHSQSGVNPLFFVLYANYGGNDNNVNLDSPRFQALLKNLDKKGTVGIHPSLASSEMVARLNREVQGLSDAIGKEIRISRQHFLRVSFPDTYRALIIAGITDDYSLGYAAKPGFRAALADPFPFFDLERNEATSLIIHPVVLMDVTLKDYLRLNRDEAFSLSTKLIDMIRKVKGEFIPLWHNESFSENKKWKGWTRLYERILAYASPEKLKEE